MVKLPLVIELLTRMSTLNKNQLGTLITTNGYYFICFYVGPGIMSHKFTKDL